jgi:phage gp36-like protein
MAYATRVDIETIFGETEVKTWADRENRGTAAQKSVIDARITAALAYAEEWVNDFLRGGAYAVPLVAAHARVTRAAAQVAAVYLYDPRGFADKGENETHRLQPHMQEAVDFLGEVKAGTIRLAGETLDDSGPNVYDFDADRVATDLY